MAKLRIDNHRATDLTLLGDKPNCESLQICPGTRGFPEDLKK